MNNVLTGEIALRVISLAAGAVLVYSSIFLYEDEQGNLQNKLETWWISLNDESETAISKHAAILHGVADFTIKSFDWLFGKTLLSERSFLVSLLLSGGVTGASDLWWPAPRMPFSWRFTASAFGCLWIMMAVFVGRSGQKELRIARRTLMLTFGLLLFLMVIADASERRVDASLRYAVMYLVMVGSVMCDWMVIAFSRWTLLRATDIHRMIPLVATLVANLGMAFALVWGPLNSKTLKFSIDRDWGESAGLILAKSNLADAMILTAFAVLVAAAVLHRLLWPVLSRPLYAIQGLGIERRRKLFFAIGTALLILGGLKVPEAFKQILK